ncbi:hypothetical protein V6N13_047705 [Hibiscus sabdariffa]|uniref:Uncharacterized protein n=1 Tax=Hibiscus sabdariffa TaxID=183260 RepID=A0ABR2F4Z4_9ROSI
MLLYLHLRRYCLPRLGASGQVLSVQEYDIAGVVDVGIQRSFLAVQGHSLSVIRLLFRHLNIGIELDNAYAVLVAGKGLSSVIIHIPCSFHKLGREAGEDAIGAG